MTDEPDIEASLADLEKTQKRYQRVFRRSTVMALAAFLVLALLDEAFVALGGGVWVWRDTVTVGGLTVLGMVGYLGAATAYKALVSRDADLIDSFRKRAELEKALREVRDDISPLMQAIHDARARGVMLVIHPLDDRVPPAEPSVH